MAYCNIQNDFLGKKLDNQFYENNRNLIASLIESKDFKDWFGNGKKDFEGKNPLIDGALSFTNEKGQKKTIFDFGFVGLNNQADTFRLLNSFKATFLHKGEMFINNTLKDATGKYSAELLMNAINVIN